MRGSGFGFFCCSFADVTGDTGVGGMAGGELAFKLLVSKSVTMNVYLCKPCSAHCPPLYFCQGLMRGHASTDGKMLACGWENGSCADFQAV